MPVGALKGKRSSLEKVISYTFSFMRMITKNKPGLVDSINYFPQYRNLTAEVSLSVKYTTIIFDFGLMVVPCIDLSGLT